MADLLLLITKDRIVAQSVRAACENLQVELTVVDTLKKARAILSAGRSALVLCEYAVFETIRGEYPRVSVLLFGDPASSEQAIEAIKKGALDYLVMPIGPDALEQHLREAFRVSRDIHVPAVYEDSRDEPGVERIIGQSPAMREVYKLIGRIAPRDVNVLITGESGTGKELIARAILHHSPRKDQPYLAVNCAAIPDTLLESELFGHEKGSFTGATIRRIGKFEQCDTGTIFLDEIGDIPLSTQAKLLRVLQDSSFQRLGGTQVIRCDVRILAATHQPLEKLIERRLFREDLYYRLKVATIHVPPLREREVDAVLLAHQVVRRYNRSLGTHIRSFAPEVLPALLKYDWPGNVRELENAIKAALVVSRGSVLRLEALPEHIRTAVAAPKTPSTVPSTGAHERSTPELRAVAERLLSQPALEGKLHDVATRHMEREIIRLCLERTRGRLAPAARLLGISRATLRKKMNEFGIRGSVSFEFGDEGKTGT